MTSRQVLIIRNLPTELSDADKEDFLRHFGALSIKILPFKKKPIAFAKFDTETKARNVLYRLHQLEILGHRLVVEYAKETLNLVDPRIDKGLTKETKNTTHDCYNEFIKKLNSWHSALNFHQPPPAHLKYSYPKANVATINNIAHALASVPKFYTQVLHLMNKMNLPPPFSNIPDPPELQIHQNPPEESESEIESDDTSEQLNQNVPIKRKKSSKQYVKRPKFIKPTPVISTSSKNIQSNELFDKIELETGQKRIEVKVTSDSVESIKNARQETVLVEDSETSFIKIKPVQSEDVVETEQVATEATTSFDVISDKELAANRILEKDFDHLQVFKNYHAGAPSCRLYIKNLSKNITVDDLQYIYKRYLDVNSDSVDMFDIRLMQEGRMKGQAFVTLQSVELAQKALSETNGYILKDKPIVVVFARSAKPKT